MNETQETIAAWAAETFRPSSPLALLCAANQAMATLLQAAASPVGTHAAIRTGCAETATVLFRYAAAVGFDLVAEAAKVRWPVDLDMRAAVRWANRFLAEAIQIEGARIPSAEATAKAFRMLSFACSFAGASIEQAVSRHMAEKRKFYETAHA